MTNIDMYLIECCQDGDLETVERLHKDGGNLCIHRNAPLLYACKYGHLNIIKYLHTNGVDIHIKNDFPLAIAAYYNNIDVVKYLLNNGANINDNRNDNIYFCRQSDNLWYVIRKHNLHHNIRVLSNELQFVLTANIKISKIKKANMD